MESFAEHLAFLRRKALQLRIDMLEMLHKAGSGHVGGALSVMEIMVALYYGKFTDAPVMKFDPAKPGWDGQDYFVLSKGHAAPSWYAVLADLGFFPREELAHFRQINSMLQAYPSKKIPGIPLSSGLPAQGLSASVGLSMSLKMDRAGNRVFCVVGDGELQEGQVWEALMAASQYKLDNLIVIVDWNQLQREGTVRSVIDIEPLAEKFQSFGWQTVPVRNGHDFDELLYALDKALEVQRKPTAILARTVKGKGVLLTEGKPSYHAKALSDAEMNEVLPRLKNELTALEQK